MAFTISNVRYFFYTKILKIPKTVLESAAWSNHLYYISTMTWELNAYHVAIMRTKQMSALFMEQVHSPFPPPSFTMMSPTTSMPEPPLPLPLPHPLSRPFPSSLPLPSPPPPLLFSSLLPLNSKGPSVAKTCILRPFLLQLICSTAVTL